MSEEFFIGNFLEKNGDVVTLLLPRNFGCFRAGRAVAAVTHRSQWLYNHGVVDKKQAQAHSGLMSITVTVTKASDKMTAENQARMVALKAEYSKLSTSARRMTEIMAEIKALIAEVR